MIFDFFLFIWCIETIKVIYSNDIGTIVDFYPSGDCAVIYISPAELVEGQQYRKKLVQLKAVCIQNYQQLPFLY